MKKFSLLLPDTQVSEHCMPWQMHMIDMIEAHQMDVKTAFLNGTVNQVVS